MLVKEISTHIVESIKKFNQIHYDVDYPTRSEWIDALFKISQELKPFHAHEAVRYLSSMLINWDGEDVNELVEVIEKINMIESTHFIDSTEIMQKEVRFLSLNCLSSLDHKITLNNIIGSHPYGVIIAADKKGDVLFSVEGSPWRNINKNNGGYGVLVMSIDELKNEMKSHKKCIDAWQDK